MASQPTRCYALGSGDLDPENSGKVGNFDQMKVDCMGIPVSIWLQCQFG